ncbi:MAG: fibronectin type III domain-containing protein [Treponema sp.]|nr:fibronectin type III domain-containing protein [Treponema sp.]
MKKTTYIKRMTIKTFAAAALSAALLTGCADMFQDRVPMQSTTNGATLSKIFEKKLEIEKLEAPSQVFVTNGEYNNTIIINWEKVTGARSYNLQRAIATEKNADGSWKIPDEGAFEALPHSTFIVGTSFTDTIIDDSPSNVLDYKNEAYNCAYFYRVLAENKIDKYEESDWFPNYYKTDENGDPVPPEQRDPEAKGILLAPPSNVKASCGKYTNKIDITWDKAVGSISTYKIFRSLNSDGSSGTQIATVYGNRSDSTIEIEPANQGTEYYFTVVSVGSSGKESVSSPVALGYALKPGAPSEVSGVEITKGRGETTSDGFTVSWQAASGGMGDLKYRVYRYSSADSTQKKLADGLTVLTYHDTRGLKPNLFYYYQIQAYCVDSKSGEELKGSMSESGDESDNPAEAYLLSPPQSVAVKKIQGDISQNSIVFSAAIGSQDCSYNSAATIKKADWKPYTYVVYGGDSAAGSFAQIAEFTSPAKSTEEGMYEEKVAAYKFYKVSVKNGSVESETSAAIAPAPYAAKNLVVTKNAAISGYTNNDANANANGVHAIKLYWKAPDGGADGGYNVYRSTKANSGFKKINESPITETSYIYKDEQAKAGNYYYYRVLSLNSLGQGANYSDTQIGYGALTTYQYVREYIKTTLNSQKKLTLMHKSGNTAKLGTESAQGAISGSLSYDAHISGVSGRVIMRYTNYADFYIMDDKNNGVYFLLDGNTNTSAGVDTNGTMDGTVTVQGMYPGSVVYDGIKIKGGAAGGGTYGVTRNLAVYKDDGSVDAGKTEKITVQADWTWGEK